MDKVFRVLIKLGLRNRILKSKVFHAPKSVNYEFKGSEGEVRLLHDRIPTESQGIGITGIQEDDHSPAMIHVRNQGNSARKTLLYFHGNSDCLGTLHNTLVKISHKAKVDLLAVEYPGYGLNKDIEPGDIGMIEHGMYAYDYATQQLDIDFRDLILMGFSLGTGPSTFLSAHPDYPTGGLIIEGGFTSGLRAMNLRFTDIYFRDLFPSSYYMAFVDVPTLIIHAKNDKECPFTEAEILFKTSPQNYKPLYFEEGGHCDIIEKNEVEYFQGMSKFLRTCNKVKDNNSSDEFKHKLKGGLQDHDFHFYNQTFPPKNMKGIEYFPYDLLFERNSHSFYEE